MKVIRNFCISKDVITLKESFLLFFFHNFYFSLYSRTDFAFFFHLISNNKEGDVAFTPHERRERGAEIKKKKKK